MDDQPIRYETDVEWPDYDDDRKVQILFESPSWDLSRYLDQETEPERTRLLELVEARWRGLDDDHRAALLLRGPQWMRDGVRERASNEEVKRLERLADAQWRGMSDDERIEMLSRELAISRPAIAERETDDAKRAELLELADERAKERVLREIDEWKAEHPGEPYSTAAHYSTGPTARIIENYWDYDATERLTCPGCGWEGPAADGALSAHDELFDVSCASCGRMLLIVSYPTIAQTKEAAEAGNTDAQAELKRFEAATDSADDEAPTETPARFVYYEDRDDILCRQPVLDEEEELLGLGQIMWPDGSWVYRFLDPHDLTSIDAETARPLAGGHSIIAPVSGYSGDHEHGRDESRWGAPGGGSGRAMAGDMRDIENRAKAAGRELTIDEAREIAQIRERMRALYERAWQQSLGRAPATGDDAEASDQ